MHLARSPSHEREPKTTSITWLRLPTRYSVLFVITMLLPPFTPIPAPCVSWITLSVNVMSEASYCSHGATMNSNPVPWPAVKPPVPAS